MIISSTFITASLTRVCLSRNVLYEGSGSLLASMLKNNVVLIHLDLSVNKLGTKGIVDLAAGLAKNVALQELNLKSNRIGSEAVSQIPVMCQSN